MSAATMSAATMSAATMSAATVAVPRLDRIDSRNRQRGCGSDEKLGCSRHR
jgi:hypothetical protein